MTELLILRSIQIFSSLWSQHAGVPDPDFPREKCYKWHTRILSPAFTSMGRLCKNFLAAVFRTFSIVLRSNFHLVSGFSEEHPVQSKGHLRGSGFAVSLSRLMALEPRSLYARWCYLHLLPSSSLVAEFPILHIIRKDFSLSCIKRSTISDLPLHWTGLITRIPGSTASASKPTGTMLLNFEIGLL